MQKYVLTHPEYQKHNKSEQALRANQGEKKMMDFCMVNYPSCLLELKAFYMLKTLDGELGHFEENLLEFGDFSKVA